MKHLLFIFLLALYAGCALSQKQSCCRQAESVGVAAAEKHNVHLLFIQSAARVSVQNDSMRLHGVSPTTVFFSDRPERITGHMPTAQAMSRWAQGDDSFAADPPNAVLSVFSNGKTRDSVIELRNPVLAGDVLTYDIKILRGKPPAGGGPCTLFIDSIGRPFTPRSYSGAARRYMRNDDGTVVYVNDDDDSDDDDDDDDN